MNHSLARAASAALVLLSLAGCAGGWRNGMPPADVATAATPAAAPAAAAAAASDVSHGTADGAVFVWKGGGNTVNVAGEFNGWNTSADAMVKGADGTFTLTKALQPGRYAYKFVVDGGNWKEDPTAKETVDDGYGGKNAIIVVGGSATAAAPAAPAAPKPAAAAPAAGGAGTRETKDGVLFVWKGGGNTVNVAGEFNGWNTSADAMVKQADGSFTLLKPLAPGRYPYKFVVDGVNWKEDPTAQETVDDGYGGKNAIIVVGGSATAAAPAATGATPAAPAAVTGKGKAPAQAAGGVTFTYAGPASKSVHLAGDFNDWSTTADPLSRQSDGTWTLTRKIAPGTYTYKFVVDGTTWKTDEANPAARDDGFGGKNSVVTVK